MKLRTKIQLFTSLFMLILILLINTSIYYLFYNITVDSELDELVDQTNMIVKRLNENPNIQKKELLRAYLPQDGMIRVIQADDTLLLPVLAREEKYANIPPRFSDIEQHEVRSENQHHVATVAKPVIWENGTVVTLEVSRHLTTLKHTMTTLLYVLVAASLFMLIPTYIAGHMLGRFLLKPIKVLTKTMQTNSQHAQWEKIELNNRSRDELAQMEATFNQMIEHIKDNFDKQEMFVSNASHELKTPISIIKSYAHMVKRRGYDDHDLIVESIEAIDSEAERMQKLVEQMLELAKNKGSTKMDDMDLANLAAKTVATFRKAYERQITYHQPDTPVYIRGNSDQLQQVLYILIDNALKYSSEDVIIQLGENADCAWIDITDHGQGIPAAAQPHIFNRFYRVDKARSRETGGTGLGLAIAKTIAQTHHGDLSLNSEEGVGTTFRLKLPKLKES
ncbi:HAMP domain-containing histidine kinase [Lentibacillus saliphilus]|uniref:HAMP domain-containing histidine kinase n=1 Tax=Lentibacillus saliphilus TaxID=2737028 RepID=UPI001C3087DE|nr:HAMP domain-containing histidine kinase [Lentibacillus saliphilus]